MPTTEFTSNDTSCRGRVPWDSDAKTRREWLPCPRPHLPTLPALFMMVAVMMMVVVVLIMMMMMMRRVDPQHPSSTNTYHLCQLQNETTTDHGVLVVIPNLHVDDVHRPELHPTACHEVLGVCVWGGGERWAEEAVSSRKGSKRGRQNQNHPAATASRLSRPLALAQQARLDWSAYPRTRSRSTAPRR